MMMLAMFMAVVFIKIGDGHVGDDDSNGEKSLGGDHVQVHDFDGGGDTLFYSHVGCCCLC